MNKLILIKVIFLAITFVFLIQMMSIYFPNKKVLKTITPPSTHQDNSTTTRPKYFDFNSNEDLEKIVRESIDSKDPKELKLYLENKIDIQDKDGMTALMYAVKYGQLKLVKTLLNLNADINLKNRIGLTARDIAIRNSQRAILNLLNNKI